MKKKHSIDLKINAVLKASKPGITASAVAQEIGIHTFSLYRWKKELRDAGLLSKMPKKRDIEGDLEQAEQLKQLKKENEYLKMENAILKKQKELGEAKRKKPSK